MLSLDLIWELLWEECSNAETGRGCSWSSLRPDCILCCPDITETGLCSRKGILRSRNTEDWIVAAEDDLICSTEGDHILSRETTPEAKSIGDTLSVRCCWWRWLDLGCTARRPWGWWVVWMLAVVVPVVASSVGCGPTSTLFVRGWGIGGCLPCSCCWYCM